PPYGAGRTGWGTCTRGTCAPIRRARSSPIGSACSPNGDPSNGIKIESLIVPPFHVFVFPAPRSQARRDTPARLSGRGGIVVGEFLRSPAVHPDPETRAPHRSVSRRAAIVQFRASRLAAGPVPRPRPAPPLPITARNFGPGASAPSPALGGASSSSTPLGPGAAHVALHIAPTDPPAPSRNLTAAPQRRCCGTAHCHSPVTSTATTSCSHMPCAPLPCLGRAAQAGRTGPRPTGEGNACEVVDHVGVGVDAAGAGHRGADGAGRGVAGSGFRGVHGGGSGGSQRPDGSGGGAARGSGGGHGGGASGGRNGGAGARAVAVPDPVRALHAQGRAARRVQRAARAGVADRAAASARAVRAG